MTSIATPQVSTDSDFTTRDQQLHTWLSQVFPSQDFCHNRLPGDASFRGYHRLEVGDKHYIIMDAPPDKESVKEFVAVDKLMATYVHVPMLTAIDEMQGFIVMEDLGTTDFADVIGVNDTSKDKVQTERYYKQAMQAIIAIQKIDLNTATAIIPHYDEALLTREMGLFSEWFLPYLGVTLDEHALKLWQTIQAAIIEQVTKQPQVVVHRDFHSRNLMILAEHNDLGVIDFQDAVIGAYTYDLASLLRDAYIDFDESWVKKQVEQYYQLANIAQNYGKTLSDFTADFNMMSMQRHLKVLGIFIRLYERDGKDRYLGNMPKVMGDLMHALAALNQQINDPSFKAFYDWLASVVMPKFNEKF